MSLTVFALIGAAISIGLGFIWYGKPLFGNAWMKLNGMTMPEKGEEMKNGMKRMLVEVFIQFVASFLTAAVLFMLLRLFGAATFGMAVPIALVLFLGFILPSETGSVLWKGKAPRDLFKMWAISIGYQVVLFVLWLVLYGIAS
jgi:hypothetical protein